MRLRHAHAILTLFSMSKASIAPKIVGKQGNCIKQMIASSGANIVVERGSDGAPAYADSSRTVTVSGTTDAVVAATILIVEKVDDLERTSAPRRPSDRDFDRRERPPPPYNYDAGPSRDWYGGADGGDRAWNMAGGGGGMDPYAFSAPRGGYGYPDEPRGGGGDFRDGGGYFPPPAAHRDPPPHYAPPRFSAPPRDAVGGGSGASRDTTLTIRVPAKFAGQVRLSPPMRARARVCASRARSHGCSCFVARVARVPVALPLFLPISLPLSLSIYLSIYVCIYIYIL